LLKHSDIIQDGDSVIAEVYILYFHEIYNICRYVCDKVVTEIDELEGSESTDELYFGEFVVREIEDL
jgi:hypothetical protein